METWPRACGGLCRPTTAPSLPRHWPGTPCRTVSGLPSTKRVGSPSARNSSPPWPNGSEARLQESHTEVGAHGFEYSGKWLDAPAWRGHEEVVSAAAFTVPTEFLLEHGPDRVRDLALALAAELPWSFGYVTPALVSPGGLRSSARHAVHRELPPGAAPLNRSRFTTEPSAPSFLRHQLPTSSRTSPTRNARAAPSPARCPP